MKSFEAEMGMGAAAARDGERQYIEAKAGSMTGSEVRVPDALEVPELHLESTRDEARRIADINRRTTGTLSEQRISEAVLRAQGVEAGANPNPTRANESRVSAREYFAAPSQDALLESEAMAELRSRDPVKAERMAHLKRSLVSREADILSLESRISAQVDPTIQAAQAKVLAQFRREREIVKRELDELMR